MKLGVEENVPVSSEAIIGSSLFQEWMKSFSAELRLAKVLVTAAQLYDGQVTSLDIQAEAVDSSGRLIQDTFTLVYEVVDVLALLNDGQQEYALGVLQSRIAVGQSVLSNPSGHVKAGEELANAALRELGEELGVELPWSSPKNLNEMVTQSPHPLLVSPGMSNERVTFFVAEAYVSPEVIKELHQREAGLADEGEYTRVRPVPIEEVPQMLADAGGDLKMLTAWLMYRYVTHMYVPRVAA